MFDEDNITAEQSGFILYRTYLAARLHFDKTKNFNASEVGWQTKASMSAFMKRPDWRRFAWGSRLLEQKTERYVPLMCANVDPKGLKLPWVGAMMNKEAVKKCERLESDMRAAPAVAIGIIRRIVPGELSHAALKSTVVEKTSSGFTELQRAIVSGEVSIQHAAILDSVLHFTRFYGYDDILFGRWSFAVARVRQGIAIESDVLTESVMNNIK